MAAASQCHPPWAFDLLEDVCDHASPELYSEAVRAAVQRDGEALEFASEIVRGKREIVLAAVTQNVWALRFASEELRADRDILLAAVVQDGRALQYASKLSSDREIIFASLAHWGHFTDGQGGEEGVLAYASAELRGDRAVCLAAVTQDATNFELLAEELRDDHELVKIAVDEDGDVLEFASARWRADREIVLAAAAECQLASKNKVVEQQTDPWENGEDPWTEACRIAGMQTCRCRDAGMQT